VGGILDPARFLRSVLQETKDRLGIEGIGFFGFDGGPVSTPLTFGPLPVGIESMVDRLRNAQVNVALPVTAEKGMNLALLPLRGQNQVRGAVYVYRLTAFTPPEIQTLTGLSRLVGQLMDHWAVQGQLAHRLSILGGLLEMSATMTVLQDLDDLFPKFATVVRQTAEADAVVVIAVRSESAQAVAAEGVPEEVLRGLTMPMEGSLTGWVVRTGAPLLLDQADDPPFPEVTLLHRAGFQRHLAIPISRQGRVRAVFTAHRRSARSWSEEDVSLLSTLSTLMAVAMENADLHEGLKRQMAELAQAHDQVVQSAKLAALGEMVAKVAHEVNNPLTSVIGYTGLVLRDVPESDPVREMVQIVHDEALRTREIVHGLLDFVRRRPPSLEAVNLKDLVQASLAHLRSRGEVQEVCLAEEYGELPSVQADSGQIRRVVLNLLTNAMDAMPEGGTVTVRTSLSAAGEWAEIVVSDTGVGIPPEILNRIFEPFFSTKAEGHGTGLGLAVSREIIERHAGEMVVESMVGVGSTFRVRLPLGED
jgi:signal transduction histidine kinase